jgi:CBS domain-containing protein
VLATDLLEDYPTVGVATPAVDAARTIGRERLPGVVVLSDDGRPLAVLGSSQVLKFLIPGYLQEDPSLVAVYDELSADACAERLVGKSVGDLLPHPDKRQKLPVVEPDATVLECAAVMASLRSPLLVVRDGGRTLGVITASRLLSVLVD